jgi:predicted alpha/beta hydrolase family esterase
MLARLLLATYLVQLLTGALLSAWLLADSHQGGTLLLLALAGGLAWIVMWQAVIIGIAMLQSRPAGPLAPWVKAAWGEFKAALLIFGLRQPWVRTKPVVLPPLTHAKADPSALPVLLVHGFICNHRVWNKVSNALRHEGHSVLSLDLEPLFASIDDYAPLINRALDSLLSQTGASKVVLVGHSMGGLAIRAWMRAFGTEKVARIITLGTPHQGTQVPQWFRTPNVRQMAWHSAWLTELSQSETPAHRQLMHLALTHHDKFVHPQREQTLDGVQVTEFSGIGHLQMCLDDEVIHWLVEQVHDAQ